jgi:hypothetical protein
MVTMSEQQQSVEAEQVLAGLEQKRRRASLTYVAKDGTHHDHFVPVDGEVE